MQKHELLKKLDEYRTKEGVYRQIGAVVLAIGTAGVAIMTGEIAHSGDPTAVAAIAGPAGVGLGSILFGYSRQYGQQAGIYEAEYLRIEQENSEVVD